MLFLNSLLLLGIGAVAAPVIIHLLNRRHASIIEWGAMQFLLDTMIKCRRRILLEDMLLLACRCLLVVLLALSFARPFVPMGSRVPWALVLPLMLIAITLFAISFALWRYPNRRRWVLRASMLTALIAVTAVFTERWLNLQRFGSGRARDVALIIDGSSSMTMEIEGRVNFDRALNEARSLIENSPRGTAFSLLVGGPTPIVITPSPISDRAQLYRQLEALRPSMGTMKTLDVIGAAALTLAQGHRSAKQIVLISDSQRVGWDLNKPEEWQYIQKAFDRFPSPPQLILRRLVLPSSIRNLAVSKISLSRDVIGTDREVRIDVSLLNTGTEATTPREVRLQIGSEVQSEVYLEQIEPGAEQRVSFFHRFKKPGAHVIEATLIVDDELAADNVSRKVVHVVDRLRILIADGSSSVRFADRAGGYIKLALAPEDQLEENDGQRESLAAPEWISASALTARVSFDEYTLVVLADIEALPLNVAERLTLYVQKGGSLMVLHGARSQSRFYNNWMLEDSPFMPFPLLQPVIPDEKERPGLDPTSFTHSGLTKLRQSSDLARIIVNRYWKLDESAGFAGNAQARFSNGDIWLAAARRGKGKILQSATTLDAAAGNLVSLRVFVPFIHALIYDLASTSFSSLNVEPARSHNLRLVAIQPEDTVGKHGIDGVYFKDHARKTGRTPRSDEQINFNWGAGAPINEFPPDEFSVLWAGSLVPAFNETYIIAVEAEGAVDLVLDGQTIINKTGEARVEMQAQQRRDLVVNYYAAPGNSSVRLFWESYSQKREVIPAEALRTQRGRSRMFWTTSVQTKVIGPDGKTFDAEFFSVEDGIALRITRSLPPGLYEVLIPTELTQALSGVKSEKDTIPFCVMTDAQESMLTPLSEDDAAYIIRHVDFLIAENEDDAIRALAGKAFGRELWRMLALAALFLVFGEVFLTRWIAVQRRLGENETVEFSQVEQQMRMR